MPLLINDRMFLGHLGMHRDLVRRLSDPLADFGHAEEERLIEQSAALLGETTFLDMAICAAARRMPGAIAGYGEFVDAAWNTVRAKGVVGWLFRMIWHADHDATASLRGGDAEQAAFDLRYLHEVCAMAAIVMLRWAPDDPDATRYAMLLLGDRHDDALSMWLPQTDITVDQASFQRMNERLRRHREQERMRAGMSPVPPAPPMPPALPSASVPPSAPPAPPAPSNGAETPAPFGPMELQYLFDADHVIVSYQSFWRKANEGEPDDPRPTAWDDRDFVHGCLTSLAGLRMFGEALDDSIENADREAFDTGLELLRSYQSCVRGNGVLALLAHVVVNLSETLDFGDESTDGDAAFEKAHRLRDACRDMAEVVLSRVADAKLRRRLATQLLTLDMDGYFATVEAWNANQETA